MRSTYCTSTQLVSAHTPRSLSKYLRCVVDAETAPHPTRSHTTQSTHETRHTCTRTYTVYTQPWSSRTPDSNSQDGSNGRTQYHDLGLPPSPVGPLPRSDVSDALSLRQLPSQPDPTSFPSQDPYPTPTVAPGPRGHPNYHGLLYSFPRLTETRRTPRTFWDTSTNLPLPSPRPSTTDR